MEKLPKGQLPATIPPALSGRKARPEGRRVHRVHTEKRQTQDLRSKNGGPPFA